MGSDASGKAGHGRDQQLSDRAVQVLFEQLWNRDLSAYDPDGPLPDIDPDPEAAPIIQGRAFIHQDRFETVRTWRAIAEEQGLSIRGLAAKVSPRTEFVGTPEQVADALDAFVQADGADGVVIGGHHTPHGIDEFVDRVVPLLQERGSLRTDYTGTTLRENLGLPIPERRSQLAGTA